MNVRTFVLGCFAMLLLGVIAVLWLLDALAEGRRDDRGRITANG